MKQNAIQTTQKTVPAKTSETQNRQIDYREYDIHTLLWVAFVIAILTFTRYGTKKFAESIPFKRLFRRKEHISDKKLLADIKQHLFFNDIQNNIQVNIHNISHACELRKVVFTDALVSRMEAIREEIVKIIERPDYFHISSEQFRNIWLQFEQNVTLNWHNRCEQLGLFPYIIGKLDEIFQDKVNIINALIESVCKDASKKDISQKTDTILDILKAIHYSLIVNTLEETLKYINGFFNGKSYKGISCTDCGHCIPNKTGNDDVNTQ